MFHQDRDGAMIAAASRKHRMRRFVGGPIQLAISQAVQSGFNRRPIWEPSSDFFKPFRDRLFDLILGELDEPSARMEASRPNMFIRSFRHRWRMVIPFPVPVNRHGCHKPEIFFPFIGIDLSAATG
jgi:hypothetical protein